MLGALKALRNKIAKEDKLPAFVVFSDATLLDMCRKRPRTYDEMLSVSGVGYVKMGRYGERFLSIFAGEGLDIKQPANITDAEKESYYGQLELSDEPIGVSQIANSINNEFMKLG